MERNSPDEVSQIAQAKDVIASNLARDEIVSYDLDCYVYQNPTLRRSRYIDIPQAILDCYDHLACKSFLGILPEINRVYITIDNRLFLWNYRDDSYTVFDELGQIIISVGLVKPKPGVFVSDIVYLLVIATPTEIVLLGVRFDGDSVLGDLELVPTSFFVSSDNIHMLKIIGTPAPSSRIFCCGKDGCIYEIDYSPGSRWFSKKCRKLNHSGLGMRLQQLLPLPFLKTPAPIIDMLIDESRAFLYILSSDSSILKFELGEDFSTMNNAVTLSSANSRDAIFRKLETSGHDRTEALDNQNRSVFRIVSLALADSGTADLIVTSQHGHRIYLSSQLQVLFVRICPRYVSNPVVGDLDHTHTHNDTHELRQRIRPYFMPGSSPQELRHAIYRNGTLLCADSRDSESDTLLCWTATPSNFEFILESHENLRPASSQPGQASYGTTPSSSSKPPESGRRQVDENVETHVVGSHIHALVEQPLDFYLSSEISRSLYSPHSQSPIVGLSTFSTQHSLPRREFLVLSSKQLIVFTQSRPVDELAQILSATNKQIDDTSISRFFIKYGALESCAMCLILICSSSTRLLSNTSFSPVYQVDEMRASHHIDAYQDSDYSNASGFSAGQRIKHAAVDAFQTYGGDTSFDSRTNQPRFSGRHDALYSYASRVLRSIWQWSIVVESTATPGLCSLRFATNTWRIILTSLKQLQHFMEEFPQNRLSSNQSQSPDAAAASIELNSLKNLEKLIARTIEVLRLCVIISDTDLITKVVARMESANVYRLLSLSMRDLVASGTTGFETLQCLLRAFMDQNGTADRQLLEELQSACPTYIDASDLYLFQGNQSVLNARRDRGHGKSCQKFERDAIDSFKKAAALEQFPLHNTLDKLRDIGLFRGIVELCLHRASLLAQLDNQVSRPELSTVRHGANDNKRQRRQMLQTKRQACFQAVLSLLDELDDKENSDEHSSNIRGEDGVWIEPSERDLALRSALEACLASQDIFFLHSFFFPWYIAKTQPPPYEIESVEFEKYLKLHRHHHDRLKLYYTRLGKFGAASRHFYSLALDDSLEERFGLNERILFLHTAIECTKHFDSNDDTTLIFELRKSLTYAEIQQSIVNKLEAEKRDCVSAQETWESLSKFLLPAEQLYNAACERRCYEDCLSILFLEDSREHTDVINTFWSNIVQQIIMNKESSGSNWRLAVREKIVSLGARYRHTRFMFPIEFLCSLLERLNSSRTSTGNVEQGLVLKIFIEDLHISLDELIPVYTNLIRQLQQYRSAIFVSVVALLSPKNLNSLNVESATYRQVISDGVFLIDMCLHYEPQADIKAEMSKLRQVYHEHNRH